MRQRLILVMVVLCVLAPPASARRWTVLPDGSGDAPTIQAAIAASSHHDTVLVMPGTYHENLRFLGKKIVVGSLYLLTADSTVIAQTVIDGSEGGSSVVQFIDAEEPGSALRGLTLTGGEGSLWGWPRGGGILIYEASPTLRDLIIRENMHSVADEYGGGIAVLGGAPLVERCLIEENEAGYGGALAIEGPSSRPLFRDCVIRANRGRYSAVADIWYGAAPRFERVTIAGNGSIGWVARLFELSAGCTLELVNCTVAENATDGLAVWDQSEVVVVNGIVWGNAGSGFRIGSDGVLVVAASDVEGGEGGLVLSPGAEVHWLGGNIDQDPLFVDSAAGDFRLLPASPCLDSGLAYMEWDGRTIVLLGPGDYCGEAPEMGSCEWCPDPAGVAGQESEVRPERLVICPNPIRQGAEIRFGLEQTRSVQAEIRDAAGRLVRRLHDGQLRAGRHQLRWDGCDAHRRSVASGAYWVRVDAGGEVRVEKLLVVR